MRQSPPSCKLSLGVLLAAVGVVASLAAGCSDGDDISALPAGSFVAASGSLSPTVHLFGDTVTAEVAAVVDSTKLDPGRLSLKTSFEPYTKVGRTQITRRDAGGLSEVRYRVKLRCLERACMTNALGTLVNPEGGAPRSFRFPPAQLLYADPGAKEPRLLRPVRFTPLESVSRINAQDTTQVYGFPFRAEVAPLPTLSRRDPTTIALVLLLIAAALLVLPATLALRWWRKRRQPPPPEPEPEPTALERAITLVEWSLQRENGAERREALNLLADELDDLETNGLADETRVAAWSPPSPTPVDATRILELVKERHVDA
jgi:hypothetical protein